MLIDFREREEGVGVEERVRERARNIDGREKNQSAASEMHPDCGLNPQRRYMPWLGMELATFWYMDNAPTNWASWPGLMKFLYIKVKVIYIPCLIV